MSGFQVLDLRNLVVLPATIVGNVQHADWQGAAQSHGAAGLAMEAMQTAVGANTEPFFIPCDSEWRIDDVQALLRQYGIKLWGVGYFNNELYFRVKKRQAHWAQYVLLRAGVPLLHGMLDGSRAIPGLSQQPRPSARENHDVVGWLLDWVGRLIG